MATATATMGDPEAESRAVTAPAGLQETEIEPLPEATRRRLYSYLLKCRTVEEKIRILFRPGRFIGHYFAAVGQEATAAGTTLDFLEKDAIAPSPRRFITQIMKGTPRKLMFAQLYGRKASPDIRAIPAASAMEHFYQPDVDKMVAAMEQAIRY